MATTTLREGNSGLVEEKRDSEDYSPAEGGKKKRNGVRHKVISLRRV